MADTSANAVEADAKALASIWDAWRHRKIAELQRFGFGNIEAGRVTDSTMHRLLKRNGCASR